MNFYVIDIYNTTFKQKSTLCTYNLFVFQGFKIKKLNFNKH